MRLLFLIIHASSFLLLSLHKGKEFGGTIHMLEKCRHLQDNDEASCFERRSYTEAFKINCTAKL